MFQFPCQRLLHATSCQGTLDVTCSNHVLREQGESPKRESTLKEPVALTSALVTSGLHAWAVDNTIPSFMNSSLQIGKFL